MGRPCRDLGFVLVLVAFVLLPGCIEPAYFPIVAVPAVTALLVQTNEKGPARVITSVAPTPSTTPVPTGIPIACPPPLGNATPVDCSSFKCREQAQRFFNALLDAGFGDCHNLDDNGDGKVCVVLRQCNAGEI